MLRVEIPDTGLVKVEIPAPLKSRSVTPTPTTPPSVLIPTPAVPALRLDIVTVLTDCI